MNPSALVLYIRCLTSDFVCGGISSLLVYSPALKALIIRPAEADGSSISMALLNS